MAEVVRIEGMRELQKSLRAIDDGSHKTLRVVLNEAATIVQKGAVRRAPQRSGAFAKSIKVASTQTSAKVSEGGSRAPYGPWLDYGGKTGRKKSVHRPFIQGGRYLYPAFLAQQHNIGALLQKRLDDLVKSSGLEVS